MEQSEARVEALAETRAFWVTSHVRIAEDHKGCIFQAGSIVQYDAYSSYLCFKSNYITTQGLGSTNEKSRKCEETK